MICIHKIDTLRIIVSYDTWDSYDHGKASYFTGGLGEVVGDDLYLVSLLTVLDAMTSKKRNYGNLTM